MRRAPTFSVIIPAKDRAQYLRHTLRTCSLQTYENLQVIVSDDGSTDNTREVVEDAARRDSRIRYVTPGRNVGMRDNFEFALDQVEPGYVLALGADDGLMPYAIEGMLGVLERTGQQLLAWMPPTFAYPSARLPTGQLTLFRQGHDRIVRSAEFLRRQARHLHYLSDVESPMFYVKGVTATELVERVRSRSPEGRFYTCPTPDGYSGIVLAGEVETYAYSATPFTLHGSSSASQGQAYLRSGTEAQRLAESFFRTVSAVPMHRELAGQPYSPLITLMTADYLLTAADLKGWLGPKPEIDFRQVLDRALGELRHSLFSAERVPRELAILDQIASRHGLAAEFRSAVARTRRFAARPALQGSALSPSMLVLDAADLGLQDIVDASFLARHVHRVAKLPALRSAWAALKASVSYRFGSRRLGDAFPPAAEWQDKVL